MNFLKGCITSRLLLGNPTAENRKLLFCKITKLLQHPMDSWKTAVLRWCGTNSPCKEERRATALRSERGGQWCSKAPFPSASCTTTSALPPQSEQGDVGSPAATYQIPAGRRWRRLVKDLGNKDRKYFLALASLYEAVIGEGCLQVAYLLLEQGMRWLRFEERACAEPSGFPCRVQSSVTAWGCFF